MLVGLALFGMVSAIAPSKAKADVQVIFDIGRPQPVYRRVIYEPAPVVVYERYQERYHDHDDCRPRPRHHRYHRGHARERYVYDEYAYARY